MPMPETGGSAGASRMFKALSTASQEEQGLNLARIGLLTNTLLVQGLSAIPWPLAVACIFYFDKSVGPIPSWHIAVWLCVMWMWCFVALAFHRHVKSRTVAGLCERSLIRQFCGIYLMNGLLWGLFVDLTWVDHNVFNNTLIIVIIIGLSVGFGFQLTAHFGVLLCAILPPLLMEHARMMIAHSDYLLPYLLLSPVFTLWTIVLSYQLNRQVCDTIRTSILNRRLATDLRVARDNAVEQKQIADSASQAKSRFLANMSHELRTPLNAVIGFAEIIKGLAFGPNAVAKYAEYAGDIERSGRHLLALINEVLDLAKIESGKLVLTRETVRLDEVLGDCLSLLDMKATEKGVALTFDNRLHGLSLEADPTALRQIFLNLLANAVKFTDSGYVRLTARVESATAVVTIEDTGPGIRPDDLKRIFDPFEQADNSLARSKGGTGLGLAIVARLIEAHGGCYIITSQVGEGTTFTVSLPVSHAKAVAA
jgi:two-component system cell cycle sensor histidine kinase PleC